MALSRDERRVLEGTTPIFLWDMETPTDEDPKVMRPIVPGELSTFTLTLSNKKTLAIINARDHVSMLNANGGTLHATSGAFQWQAESDDMVIVNVNDVAIGEVDPVIALFEWELTNGRKGKHVVPIDVVNVGHVPEVVVVP